MKKLLIISDIHYPSRNKDKKIFEKLEKLILLSDITICCGDYVSENIINFIKTMAKENFMVKGNMDFFEYNLPQKIITIIENFKIGIIHGEGSPIGIEKRVLRNFDEKPDIIFYGHSHIKEKKEIDKTILINPGAFCDGNYCFVYLDLNGIKINFERI